MSSSCLTTLVPANSLFLLLSPLNHISRAFREKHLREPKAHLRFICMIAYTYMSLNLATKTLTKRFSELSSEYQVTSIGKAKASLAMVWHASSKYSDVS